MIHRFYIK